MNEELAKLEETVNLAMNGQLSNEKHMESFNYCIQMTSDANGIQVCIV